MLDISVSLSLTGISLFSHSKIVPDSAPPDDRERSRIGYSNDSARGELVF